MEYKSFIKKAAVSLAFLMPYACDSGCNYSPVEPSKANAETRIEKTKTIETVLENDRNTR